MIIFRYINCTNEVKYVMMKKIQNENRKWRVL